jgi:imidazolonepropionase-like amidohydrolase
VLPGLIDCHDHLASRNYDLASRWGLSEPASLRHLRVAKTLEQTLASGYTCVRDAAWLDAGFKQAVEEGLIPGPRLVISVVIISPTGGLSDHVCPAGHRRPFHTDPLLPSGVADGVDAVRAKVREMVRVGADVIKFGTTGGASSRQGHGPKDIAFGPDEVKALVEEAAALGRKTMCHALGGPGLRMAVEAGAGSIDHGCYLAEEPDLLKIMADKGIFFVPTLEVYEFHSTVSAPHIQERTKALLQIHRESIQMALAAGVKVVAGTDAGGFVHGDNAHELQLLVDRGLSTMQAIQAATGWAAECVGLEKEIGTLEAGKLADLLVVDGDPLRDIGVLRDHGRIKLVMKDGEAFVDRLPSAAPQPVGHQV